MAASRSVLELVASPSVARAWTAPSVLPDMTVGGLAAHIVAALDTTLQLLGRAVPEDARVVSPLAFFGDNRREGDIVDDERGRAIVARAEAEAEAGPAAVVAALTAVVERVAEAVRTEPPDRTVPTHCIPDGVARLDDHLATRVIEVVVHGDDLAVSAGVVWHPPTAAVDVAVATLVGMARERVGDLEVLRALAREERSTPGALRAL